MQQKEEVLNYFHILKKHSSIGTAYIFLGEDLSLVSDIVKAINCQKDDYFCDNCWDCNKIAENNHPDLFIIEPTGLSVKIEQIQEGIRFLVLKSFRLKKKVVIIKQAQNLTPEAANAFLKTLEEPPANSFIAVCSPKLEGLSPTIISRCRKIFLPFQESKIDILENRLVYDFIKGRQIEFKNRKQFTLFLWSLIIFFRQALILKTDCRNNQLSKSSQDEIISSFQNIEQIHAVLKDLLRIYSVANTVNMNLALNLIRMKL